MFFKIVSESDLNNVKMGQRVYFPKVPGESSWIPGYLVHTFKFLSV